MEVLQSDERVAAVDTFGTLFLLSSSALLDFSFFSEAEGGIAFATICFEGERTTIACDKGAPITATTPTTPTITAVDLPLRLSRLFILNVINTIVL